MERERQMSGFWVLLGLARSWLVALRAGVFGCETESSPDADAGGWRGEQSLHTKLGGNECLLFMLVKAVVRAAV